MWYLRPNMQGGGDAPPRHPLRSGYSVPTHSASHSS